MAKKNTETLGFYLPNWESKCTWRPGADPATSPHTRRPTNQPKKIYSDAIEAIGNTPLIRLNKIPAAEGIKCEILVKCEYLNPGGSVKDRIAYRMIADAEEQGLIKPGTTIVESSSGNTGTGLAMICAIKGYRCVIVMQDKMSNEKADTMRALGAEVIRTPLTKDSFSPDGVIAGSQRVHKQIPNSILLDQFSNAGNPLAHYDTTAEEIFDQCGGKVDMIVAGCGTGGTLTGIARRMKELNPNCKVVAVDPVGSVLARPESLNIEPGKFSEVEGIGYEFIPTTLEYKYLDSWVKIEDSKSLSMAKRLIREEGLLCGGSSGAHVAGALEAARNLKAGQRCVVILPDSIRNYLTKHVSDAWMQVRHLQPCPCPRQEDEWWWNEKVSKLKLDRPISILPTTTCQQTLDLLKKLGVNLIPVVAMCGKFEGLASAKRLMTQLVSGRVKPGCPISKALLTKFVKLRNDTILGVLSKQLEIDGFAVILENNKNNEEIFSALVTPTDLLQYITEKPSTTIECARKST